MTADQEARNSTIAISVLNGCTLAEMATAFGISTQRCRQIVFKYCGRKNYSLYVKCLGNTEKLEALRAEKDFFITGHSKTEMVM